MYVRKLRGRRRKGYRRRGRKGVSFFNKKYSVKDIAMSAWKGVRYIKGLVNSEMYKLDYSNLSATMYNDGSTAVNMAGVAQGDGDGARTGNSVLAKSLQIKGVATRSTSGDAVQTCRIVVVMDRQNVADESNPGYTSVFTAALPTALLNATTVGRYTILADRIFTLDTVKNLSKPVNIYIPLNTHIRYNGTAATDVQRNSLWMFCISSQATSNQPVFTYNGRFSYHDN